MHETQAYSPCSAQDHTPRTAVPQNELASGHQRKSPIASSDDPITRSPDHPIYMHFCAIVFCRWNRPPHPAPKFPPRRALSGELCGSLSASGFCISSLGSYARRRRFWRREADGISHGAVGGWEPFSVFWRFQCSSTSASAAAGVGGRKWFMSSCSVLRRSWTGWHTQASGRRRWVPSYCYCFSTSLLTQGFLSWSPGLLRHPGERCGRFPTCWGARRDVKLPNPADRSGSPAWIGGKTGNGHNRDPKCTERRCSDEGQA